jgi:hypothetical protein
MKTTLHIFVGHAIAVIALWLIGGFIAMDWDFRNWHPVGRFAVAWFASFLAFAGVIISDIDRSYR